MIFITLSFSKLEYSQGSNPALGYYVLYFKSVIHIFAMTETLLNDQTGLLPGRPLFYTFLVVFSSCYNLFLNHMYFP